MKNILSIGRSPKNNSFSKINLTLKTRARNLNRFLELIVTRHWYRVFYYQDFSNLVMRKVITRHNNEMRRCCCNYSFISNNLVCIHLRHIKKYIKTFIENLLAKKLYKNITIIKFSVFNII